MTQQFDFLCKLLVIGDCDVGKTSILMRFADATFNSAYIKTVGIDFKIRTVDIDGKNIKLQMWDTSGQERFKTITTAYYKGAMGIMLLYDVTHASSFENIRSWVKNVEENAAPNVLTMIVGNKCDLDDKRVISTERGQMLADEHRAMFMETSAKSGHNVDLAFINFAREVMNRGNASNTVS